MSSHELKHFDLTSRNGSPGQTRSADDYDVYSQATRGSITSPLPMSDVVSVAAHLPVNDMRRRRHQGPFAGHTELETDSLGIWAVISQLLLGRGATHIATYLCLLTARPRPALERRSGTCHDRRATYA